MLNAFLLTHRCAVERRTTTTDRLGGPSVLWTAFGSEVLCRLTAARGGERDTERFRETYFVTHEMFIQPDDFDSMSEDDQVTVTDQAGVVLLEDARIVLKRAAYAGGSEMHHVEVLLESMRGPQ